MNCNNKKSLLTKSLCPIMFAGRSFRSSGYDPHSMTFTDSLSETVTIHKALAL